MINRFDSEGSTGDVDFVTRKRTVPVEKSEVSHVTLDGNGPEGNSWEKRMAAILEAEPNVAAFVKNDQLGFTIPYVHKGRSHSYIPDFLVRLKGEDGDVERTLIIEISGSRKSPGPTAQKRETARNSWCVAVNNKGKWGRWAYIEMKEPDQFKTLLAEAIQNLYGDKPIIGDPDLLDFSETNADITNIARSARGA